MPAKVGGVNGTCTIELKLTPAVAGARLGTLTILSAATNSPHAVSLTGTGTVPLTVSKTSLAFGNRSVGSSTTLTFTITNPSAAGAVTATGLTVGLSGATAADYTLAPAMTCGTTLAVGASCTVSVTFTPASTGAKSGTVNITWDSMPAAKAVALSGTGI